MRRRRRIWREKGWQDRDERAALTYKMRLALVQPSPSRKQKRPAHGNGVLNACPIRGAAAHAAPR